MRELIAATGARREQEWSELQATLNRSGNGHSNGHGKAGGVSTAADEALSLLEAKEYMQRIIQLLRDGSREDVARISQ
jgi:hypothetical protein